VRTLILLDPSSYQAQVRCTSCTPFLWSCLHNRMTSL